MKNKKIINKKDSSLLRYSVAEYLTFSELEENSVIQNFRITAKGAKKFINFFKPKLLKT